MSAKAQKKTLELTASQSAYLLELVQDDIEVTELTPGETERARSIIRKLKGMVRGFIFSGALPDGACNIYLDYQSED